ncbi:MAG: Gfo/Idh/MocA family oxidoreductase [Planctomycetales bacterium]|nr:Gfo/Idh/MocA family oxidoreductase [Planctomycetales bacterium]
MDKQVRWGIMSTAIIAREAVIPAMLKEPYRQSAVITAIASRELAKAQATAERFGIPQAYGSYEELLADEQVDAVYIPLPNHLHVPYAIQSLEAGKHVLCEKPIGLSVAEAEELVEAGRRHPQLRLMEAFMYRHHPQWQWARQVIGEGRIGTLRTIHSFFSYYDVDPHSIHNHVEWGGGGLMDIGCYPISLSRFLFQDEPRRVVGILEHDPKFRVDTLTSGIMEFAAGTATFTCSTQLTDYQRIIAYGTKGRVEIEIPFNAPAEQPCRATLEVEGAVEDVEFDICDQYGIQADLFSRAILDDTPVPTPIEDAVANMRVIEAIVRSGREQNWVELA